MLERAREKKKTTFGVAIKERPFSTVSMVRNLTMDQVFNEDTTGSYGVINRDNNMGLRKRNLTLDLNNCQRQELQVKRPRLGPLPTTLNIAPILSSPDLNMLKLGSPELEKLIIEQQDGNGADTEGVVTSLPTPTAQILFPKTVTEAQELYARGFVDALNELHHSDSSQEPGSLHGVTYTTLEPPGSVQSVGTESSVSQGLMQIKDEPQTVPSVSSSPPMSPIDMENQERIKLERKRQRNRVAASKCRRRKLERISRLEDKVKVLKGENSELSAVVHKLREHVCRLKEQVMDHVHYGCQIMTVSEQF
ncbi:transcription factor AP-1-like [Vespula pensylvanica]|nr:transcription factor AP-1-like [Vespula pensylvanica]